MSNLYKLTENLHKIIQEKAEKCGLEIEIESKEEFFIYFKDLDDYKKQGYFFDKMKPFLLIPPQIFEPSRTCLKSRSINL